MTGFSRISTDFCGVFAEFSWIFTCGKSWKFLRQWKSISWVTWKGYSPFFKWNYQNDDRMRIDCPVQFFINFGCVVARWDMAYFQKFLRWRLARLLELKRWKRGELYVTRLCLRVMRKHLFWTVKMWNVCRARVFFKFCVFPYLFFLRGSLSTCSWASCCQVSCAGTVCSASSPARSGGRWGESSMSFAFSSNVQTRWFYFYFMFYFCFYGRP